MSVVSGTYFTRSRIPPTVGELSRYMQQPNKSHGTTLKQILWYLQRTLMYGLVFCRGTKADLKRYSDSSHAVDEDDVRSTAGHVFYLEISLITWCSQKQKNVALSSCEAEFMAAIEAAKHAIWLQDLYEEITRQSRERVVVLVDNKSALALTKTMCFMGATNTYIDGIILFVSALRMI